MKPENQTTDVIRRFVSKGVFPYQMAFTLLIPVRNLYMSPEKLSKRLELKEDLKVLEVGPGPGYYSIKMAKILNKGKLVLADIQQKMLDYAKKRIDKRKLTNVEYYLCDGTSFNFDDNTFDRIFMVTVIGEVENKDEYLNEFYRILKEGGLLSVSELAGDSDKLTIEEVKYLAEKHKFKFYKLFGNKRNYTINFIK